VEGDEIVDYLGGVLLVADLLVEVVEEVGFVWEGLV
jgi:hypothetical protein